jgi:hypothetical protein
MTPRARGARRRAGIAAAARNRNDPEVSIRAVGTTRAKPGAVSDTGLTHNQICSVPRWFGSTPVAPLHVMVGPDTMIDRQIRRHSGGTAFPVSRGADEKG